MHLAWSYLESMAESEWHGWSAAAAARCATSRELSRRSGSRLRMLEMEKEV